MKKIPRPTTRSGQTESRRLRGEARRDDREVRDHVVACREKSRPRQSSRPRCGSARGAACRRDSPPGHRRHERQRNRRRSHGKHEIVPGRPERRDAGDQKDGGEQHADPRPARSATSRGRRGSGVDEGVLEEIDRIGEERDGADRAGHPELDGEVAEIQRARRSARPGSKCAELSAGIAASELPVVLPLKRETRPTRARLRRAPTRSTHRVRWRSAR